MIESLNAEDLFSLICRNLNQETITIKFRQVNKWRCELRSKGISIDLGRKEFETLCSHYPYNLYMYQTHIEIILEDKFVRHIGERMKKYDEQDVKLLLNLWNKANEENIR